MDVRVTLPVDTHARTYSTLFFQLMIFSDYFLEFYYILVNF